MFCPCRLGRWLSLHEIIMTRTEVVTYGALVVILTGVTIHTVNVETEQPKYVNERHEHICSTLPKPHPDCP
mgnify:CR=1 FL=1